MDQNSPVLQVPLQLLSPEQPESEEPKSLDRRQRIKLLLVFFVSSLIGTVIGLGFYYQWKTSEAPVPCLSPACQRVAERFSAVMDPFSRPCDYFLFTCGAGISTINRGRQRGKVFSHNITTGQERMGRTGRRGGGGGEGGGRMDRKSDAEREEHELPGRLPDRHTALLQTLKEILESPLRGASINMEEKAQRFYKTCTNSKTTEGVTSARFLNLIEQLGGWAVSGKWTQPDFNSTLALLMAKYNTFPFFNVYVGHDQREGQNNESQRYIQIDQPDFEFPIEWNSDVLRSKINIQTLRPFLSSCRQLLDSLDVPSSATSEHCGRYLSLCSTLVTTTSPLTYRLSQKLLYHKITIQELQLAAPAIDWLLCFRAIFYPLPVSPSDFVLLHNLPYILHMSQTISDWKNKTDSRGRDPLHTYMILKLLQTLLPALDSRISKIMKNFLVAIDSREEDVPRWRQCVLQTVKGFDTLLSHVIREQYAKEEAEELMHDIYSAFKTQADHLGWRDEESHNSVLNKVKSLSPRLSAKTEMFDSYYTEVIMSETDYFANYLQLLVLQQRRRNRLLSHTAQHDMLFINLFFTGNDIIRRRKRLFSHNAEHDMLFISPFLAGNDIIVPVGLFVSPLFHPSYPRAVNYGLLGSLIAKDLFHLLLPDICSQSESPKLVSECVWSQYITGREDSGRYGTSSLSQSQQQEVWVQYSALQVALQAYQKSLLRNSADTSLSGLSHIHLFLSSFIQASCDSEPYHVSMPFEPSFLVTVLCGNSDHCPKPLICGDKSQGHLPEWCLNHATASLPRNTAHSRAVK